MVSRYFFALCALAMFVAVTSSSVDKSPRQTDELLSNPETRKSQILDRALIDEIVSVLQGVCSVAKNCLKDVTTACKQYWLIPVKFLQCVKNYIKENHDKCVNPGFTRFY